MFQMLVSVISVALTSTLAAATYHYGGGVLSGSIAKANAINLISGAQQIGNALILSSIEDPYSPGSISEIQDVPLPPKSAAEGATWQVDPSGVAYVKMNPAAVTSVCRQIAEEGGSFDTRPITDVAAATSMLQADRTKFGCFGNGDQAWFVYKT